MKEKMKWVLFLAALGGLWYVGYFNRFISVDEGRVNRSKGEYRNRSLGLTMRFPRSFHVPTEREKELEEQFMLKLMGKKERAKYHKARKRTQFLFDVQRSSGMVSNGSNYNLQLVVERLPALRFFVSEKEAFKEYREVLEEFGWKYQMRGRPKTIDLGGRDFLYQVADVRVFGYHLRQAIFCRVDRGRAIYFILTYGTLEEKAVLEKILGSVTFEGD